MNYTLGIGILAAVFLCGCVYFIWRRCTSRHERRGYVCITCMLPFTDVADKGLKSGDLDIPDFLRRKGAGNNTIGNSDLTTKLAFTLGGRLNSATPLSVSLALSSASKKLNKPPPLKIADGSLHH